MTSLKQGMHHESTQKFNMMNYVMDGFLYAQDSAHIILVHLVRMKNFLHTYYYTEYKFVEKV